MGSGNHRCILFSFPINIFVWLVAVLFLFHLSFTKHEVSHKIKQYPREDIVFSHFELIHSMQSLSPPNKHPVFSFLPSTPHQFNYLKTTFLQDRRSMLLWSAFVLFAWFSFHFLSDGDFSFLLVQT